MSIEERKPFIDDAGETDSLDFPRIVRSSNSRNRILTVSVFVNAVLFAICVALSVTVLFLSSSDVQNAGHMITEPYSPANHIIDYEYRSIIPNDTRFTGHPGAEWGRSMSGLMEGTLLRISEEELKLYGSKSIALKGGGYAAGLGVAHNLHCIKKIKKFLYRDHFYPDLESSGEEFDYLQEHADHCLDFLRQGILCHLDYSMYTVFWGERRQDIPTHNIPGVQKCVNWDKLHKWMLDRSASTDMLIGP